MKTRFPLIALALLSLTCLADPPKVKIVQPDKAAAGRLTIIKLDTDAKNARFGKSIPGLTAADYAIDSNGRTLYVTFPKGGNYTITAVGSTNDEIGEDVLILAVSGDGGGGGGGEDDQAALVAKLQSAYNSEPSSTRKADLAAYKNACDILSESVMDAAVRTPKDMGELIAKVRDKAVGSRFGATRSIFAAEFAKFLSGDENRDLKDTEKTAASAVFKKFATALGKVKTD